MPRPARSILGDTTMLRLTGVLYLNPAASHALGDLTARLPGVNRLTVIRALNDLVEQQIAIKSGENPPRYRANERHYLAVELRSIALKTFGGFEDLARKITQSPFIAYAAIYGSFARGDPGPTSDVDILLVAQDVSDPNFTEIVNELLGAARAIGRDLNPTIYDVEEFKQRRTTSFIQNILSKPMIVLKGG